jgi:hypothetical protein
MKKINNTRKSGNATNILSLAFAALLALGGCGPRVKSAGCDIISFAVDGAAWIISGANITYVYPPGTPPTSLKPAITLSPGASITPAPGAPQNFFTAEGISYTVTAQNNTTTKTYTVKALLMIESGITGECTWMIAGKPGDYTLIISGNGAMENYGHHLEMPWHRYETEIRTLVIQDGVTTIGDYAFVACAPTGALTIPNSVTTIGTRAFWGCSGLTSVTNYSTAPQRIHTYHGGVFLKVNVGNVTLRVPASALDAYKSAPCWKNFGTIEAI